MRHPKIRDVVVWRGSAWFWNGPILQRHSVVNGDRPATARHGLPVPSLVFDAQDLPAITDRTREFALTGTSLRLAHHETLHNRSST